MPGPTATIGTASDFDGSTAPEVGDALVYIGGGDWAPRKLAMSPGVFKKDGSAADWLAVNTGNNWSGDYATITTLTIPAQPWAYEPDVHALVEFMVAGNNVRMDLEARLNSVSGPLLGRGIGSSVGIFERMSGHQGLSCQVETKPPHPAHRPRSSQQAHPPPSTSSAGASTPPRSCDSKPAKPARCCACVRCRSHRMSTAAPTPEYFDPQGLPPAGFSGSDFDPPSTSAGLGPTIRAAGQAPPEGQEQSRSAFSRSMVVEIIKDLTGVDLTDLFETVGGLIDSGISTVTRIVDDIVGIFNGLVVTPINNLVQGVKDWWAGLWARGKGGALSSKPKNEAITARALTLRQRRRRQLPTKGGEHPQQ
ncbi:MAG: hypothetical protein U5O16_19835 [Rhodococcus sp. (in: high G+C Gram-positive bacteria)]|uniref:hypothetical protein n=1 Tax=Rhodococcus sp. TaxID=1831 RepID=UPI002ADBC968|nr:hypothetical protein [Rhodococcus sp. (in: high G+C Gram-positive bacteria)]